MYRAVLYGSPYHLTFSFLATRQSCGGGGVIEKGMRGPLDFTRFSAPASKALTLLWLDFFPDINLKNALYLSVNVFGTNVLIGNTMKYFYVPV